MVSYFSNYFQPYLPLLSMATTYAFMNWLICAWKLVIWVWNCEVDYFFHFSYSWSQGGPSMVVHKNQTFLFPHQSANVTYGSALRRFGEVANLHFLALKSLVLYAWWISFVIWIDLLLNWLRLCTSYVRNLNLCSLINTHLFTQPLVRSSRTW